VPGAPAPGLARPARQLLLGSRLPVVPNSFGVRRRPVPTPGVPGTPASPALASASAAALAAGAIASGRPLPKVPTRPLVAPTPKADASADQRSVIASLTARLSQAERLNQHQAAKLAMQSQEIDMLRAELRILRRSSAEEEEDEDLEENGFDLGRAGDDAGTGGAGGTSSSTAAREVQALRAERDNFKHKCAEMTKFLEDYGLTWIGEEEASMEAVADADSPGRASDGSSRGDSGGSPLRPLPPPLQPPSSLAVDVQTLADRVEGLNATVERAGPRVVSDRVGGAVHRLKSDDDLPLPLTVFRDGVKLGAGAFQTYNSRPAQQVLRDILDGYFPYALKDEYPDGVALKVLDRTEHDFERWLRDYAPGDPDLAGGGDRLAPGGCRVIGAQFHSAKPPEKVLRGGNICEVRDGIGVAESPPFLGGGASVGNAGNRHSSAPVCRMATAAQEVSLLEPGRDPSAPMARLQVKLEGGGRLVLCMEATQTIGALEDALEAWQGGDGPKKRRPLRTAFPPRTYTDRSQTLEEAGLMPSATLFASAEPLEPGAT